MAFYKYLNFSKNHLNALEENKLWFARGSTFNDPFDGEAPLDLLTYDSMAKFIKTRPSSSVLTNAQFRNVVLKQINTANQLIKENKFNKHPIYPYYDLIKKEVYRRFILCLSRSNTNILMWSHYSQSHTGFCVRYNLEVLLNELNIFHHDQVEYSDRRPDVFNSMINKDNIDLSKEILFLKSKDWHYEKEYRLILDEFSKNENDKHRAVEYSDNAIERVYFGINSDEDDKDKLRDILLGKRVAFFQMERASSSIGVYAKRI